MLRSDDVNTKYPVYTVSDVNRAVASTLEATLGIVKVKGEVTGIKLSSQGHAYFTLKDSQSALSAVLFRNTMASAKVLQEGVAVVAVGKLSIYQSSGRYQMVVTGFEIEGTGDLYRQFIELKTRLENEGLFDPSIKKPLPAHVKTLALVTSPSGAVVHDVIQILRRLAPNILVRVIPVAVQGPEAVPAVVRALDLVSEEGLGDVVVLARGGGSLEDLAPFNSSEVAYAIARCQIPVISAIGHETDFTIADFVADHRSPTPSGAAETLGSPWQILRHKFSFLRTQLIAAINGRIRSYGQQLQGLTARLVSPTVRIEQSVQRLDDLSSRLDRAMILAIQRRTERLERGRAVLLALSPLGILERGYAIIQDAYDRPILNIDGLTSGPIKIKVKEGEIRGVFTPTV